MGAQEGHVRHALVERLRGPRPHTGALDIDADEVFVGEEAGQAHGIFAAATAQFEDDGRIAVEEVGVPAPAQGERRLVRRAGGRVGGFKHMGIGRHVGKFGKFILSHLQGIC